MLLKNTLVSYADMYKELHTHNAQYPLIYEIKKKKLLFYCGTQHSYDPQNPQFVEIENYLNDFHKKVGEGPCIVLVEGNVPPVAVNKTAAIKLYAEPGFVTYLASKYQIEVYSPEPSTDYELAKLLKSFSLNEVLIYYFITYVFQWNNSKAAESLESYVHRYMRGRFENINVDISLQHLRDLYQESLSFKFLENDTDAFYDYLKPADNNISGYSGNIRDIYILKEIERLWKHKNIFIAYGSGHFVRHTVAIKRLIQSKTDL